MIRMQVQLSEDQLHDLRRLAAADGRSLADLVREAVDLLLRGRRLGERRLLKARSLSALGRFSSGRSDAAREHARYLEDVLGE